MRTRNSDETPRKSWLPFTEYEITRALRLVDRQGASRRAARRFSRHLRRATILVGSPTNDVAFAGLLALLALRSPEAERRADEHVRAELQQDHVYDQLFERSHGRPVRSVDERWRAWEAQKAAAVDRARRYREGCR
jgi:hypothetical protein